MLVRHRAASRCTVVTPFCPDVFSRKFVTDTLEFSGLVRYLDSYNYTAPDGWFERRRCVVGYVPPVSCAVRLLQAVGGGTKNPLKTTEPCFEVIWSASRVVDKICSVVLSRFNARGQYFEIVVEVVKPSKVIGVLLFRSNSSIFEVR